MTQNQKTQKTKKKKLTLQKESLRRLASKVVRLTPLLLLATPAAACTGVECSFYY
jgi:hypothetical protein